MKTDHSACECRLARMGAALLAVFFGLSAVAAATQGLKVDIDWRDHAVADGYTSWIVPSGSRQVSTTIDGLTFTIKQTKPAGSNATISLKAGSKKKDGMTGPNYYKMCFDGVWVHDSAANPPVQHGAMSLTIRGLSAGQHTIATYHNNIWRHVSTTGKSTDDYGAMNRCIVSVGGKTMATVTPSEYITSDDDCAAAFFTVTATARQAVVINFTPDGSGPLDAVILNAFEIDTTDPTRKAVTPLPADKDLHVDCHNDSAAPGTSGQGDTDLTWTPGNSVVSHDVYLGTDMTAVTEATHDSPEFEGNQTAATFHATDLDSKYTYYWRVDEVGSDGRVTKGDTWTFKPRHLAYPGAVGYGRWSHSGRGGQVIEVTNLNDSGPGSLRDAIENHIGPRVVVFRTGGVIALNSRLVIDPNHGDVYVAGQTAPGQGITLIHYSFGGYGCQDATIRFIRTRPGDYGKKAIDGMGLGGCNYSIIDHCSISWSIDEGTSSRGAKNITFSRNIISEALNDSYHYNADDRSQTEKHSFAGSISGHFGTYCYNLIADCAGRNWSLAGGIEQDGVHYAGYLDIRNNVVYNWRHRTTDGGVKAINFVGNYYKGGPESYHHLELFEIDGDQLNTGDMQQGYVVGNQLIKHDGTVVVRPNSDNWSDCSSKYATIAQVRSNVPLFPTDLPPQSADEAYKDVLSNVGANRPNQGPIDVRIIHETRTGTYMYSGSKTGYHGIIDSQRDVGGYPTTTDPGTPPVDSDHDGMPDWWEKIKGLDPNSLAGDFSESNGDPDGDGYTNLEDYLAWMAQPHVDCNAGSFVDIDLNALSLGFIDSGPSYTFSDQLNGTVTLVNGRYARFTPSTSDNALGRFFDYTVTDNQGDQMTRTVNVRIMETR